MQKHSCKKPSYWRVFAGNVASALTISAGAAGGYLVARAAQRRPLSIAATAADVSIADGIGVIIGALLGVVGSLYLERAIIKTSACKNPSIGRLALSQLAEAIIAASMGAAGRAVDPGLGKAAAIASPFVTAAASQRVLVS